VICQYLTCAASAPSGFREIGWIKGKRMVIVEVVKDRKVPVVSFPTTWDRGITMKELILSYPNDLAQVVQLTTEELSAHLLLMAALKMFELGKLSSGKAAELAGLSRVEFFEACGRYRVSLFNYPDDEIEAELRADVQAAAGNESRNP
jgi:predicted HTH domain antitoxin